MSTFYCYTFQESWLFGEAMISYFVPLCQKVEIKHDHRHHVGGCSEANRLADLGSGSFLNRLRGFPNHEGLYCQHLDQLEKDLVAFHRRFWLKSLLYHLEILVSSLERYWPEKTDPLQKYVMLCWIWSTNGSDFTRQNGYCLILLASEKKHAHSYLISLYSLQARQPVLFDVSLEIYHLRVAIAVPYIFGKHSKVMFSSFLEDLILSFYLLPSSSSWPDFHLSSMAD